MQAKASTQGLVGQRFGMLIAVALVLHKGRTEMLCRCDCGIEKVICIRRLVPHSRSCGCLNQADQIPTGTRFGAWTVGAYGKDPTTSRLGFHCCCTCGTEAFVEGKALRSGRSSGCHLCSGPRRVRPDTQSNNVWHIYRLGAKRRGLPFDLSRDQFKALILQQCSYCGSDPHAVAHPNTTYGDPLYHGGVDRKDSAQGYTLDNCVPCCGTCNYMKGTMPLEDFFAWAGRIAWGTANPQRYPLTEKQAANVASGYRSRAKRKGLDYTLTLPEAQVLFESACSYCGGEPVNSQAVTYYKRKGSSQAERFRFTGIDRICSNRSYTSENCRPACWTCNNAKGKHTLEAFLAHIRRIAAYQQGLISSK